MPRRRIRLRPPGVKPWTRIGPLGPFRGRLGLQWVVAPLVVGAALAVAVWLLLFRTPSPGASFVPVGRVASFGEGTARPVDAPGVFVGRTGGQLFAVLQEDGCSLGLCGHRYVDCRGASYGIDGDATRGTGGLDLLPLRVYRGQVYVDPDHPVNRTPAPAPAHPAASCPSG
jgi:hypothetical protein